MVTIYLAPELPPGSSDQPGDWAGHPIYPSIRSCSGWGLPSRPVARPLVSSYLAISPLSAWGGRYVSVALSVGLPLLGVTQHPVR